MAAKAVYDGSKDIGKSKNDRVNAMAVANTAWGAYKAGEGIANAASNIGTSTGSNGGVGKISVSIPYGQSEAEQASHDTAAICVGSTVNAGGKVNINVIGSDIYGGTAVGSNTSTIQPFTPACNTVMCGAPSVNQTYKGHDEV